MTKQPHDKKNAGEKKSAAVSARPNLFAKVSEDEVVERFNRLVDAMATTPALPKKKKRTVAPQVPEDNFDD